MEDPGHSSAKVQAFHLDSEGNLVTAERVVRVHDEAAEINNNGPRRVDHPPRGRAHGDRPVLEHAASLVLPPSAEPNSAPARDVLTGSSMPRRTAEQRDPFQTRQPGRTPKMMWSKHGYSCDWVAVGPANSGYGEVPRNGFRCVRSPHLLKMDRCSARRATHRWSSPSLPRPTTSWTGAHAAPATGRLTSTAQRTAEATCAGANRSRVSVGSSV
jgi:hypothetical protein